MWRFVVLGALVLAVVLFGFSLIDASSGGEVEASAVIVGSADPTGFTRAFEPLDWDFPRNFGAHPDYQTEWWYYTGNVTTADGRRFGYQFTIFRRGLLPGEVTTGSEWRTNQLYMAHFTVSDIEGGRFYHEERFSRGSADLAGAATGEMPYRVWLEDWEVRAVNTDASLTQIVAAGDGYAVDVTLEQLKPPALQGDGGLSSKSAEAGNASHYYSLTRLATSGTFTIGDETFTVSGYSWKDHEFSTSALGTNALGWDWFGLQFDDNRELMVGQIRLLDGGRDPNFGGLLVYPDGTTEYLPAEQFTIESTATWTSPHTGAVYPAGWVITAQPQQSAAFTITVTPQMSDQELHGGGIAYYEGSVIISGDASGFGYAELTGYVDAMTGRF
ncbi:MAG: lipocalin-like domain-containing protein [Chloroflexota bacterium]|nr:lipocalin-like domain-containing protein [Chloroflexota bacterium]